MLPAKAKNSKQSRSGMLNLTAPGGGGFAQLTEEPDVKRVSPRPEKKDPDLKKIEKNNFFDKGE
jgi:hypothetical protein